ncbi:hypothetical protein [Thiocapsa bogorovii]|uniref:hypothetical protein n=1 Tax=Thiocapsa bogorovii TaxID=521689 RepID=UPI001E57949A|nr:hypothetical protein [Thiocapsa bogorovii]UHD15575.1 hypothetical protein LT988_20285 [Thiocapsa bogorovii]
MLTAASTPTSATERVAPEASGLIARQRAVRTGLLGRQQVHADPGRQLVASGPGFGAGPSE